MSRIRFRFRRKQLALPYAAPPRSGRLRVNPDVHTAAELMASKASQPAA